MEFLLAKGFNVLSVDKYYQSCLHYFAMTGHENLARFFHDIDWQANIGMLSTTGYTPLLLAAASGSSKVFRRLLRNGASMLDRLHSDRVLTQLNVKGDSCLHSAASSGDSEIVEIIIGTHGKDCLEWRNFHGALAVHIAAAHYQHLLLEYLWEQGADLTATTPQHETPLLFAVVVDSKLATAFLLSKGVASFEKTLNSPLLAYAAVLERPYILKSLLDQGLEVADEQKDEQNLLCLAASFGSEEMLSFLLTRGLDWDSKDAHGWTARDCLECAQSSSKVAFAKERSAGPRSWLECSGWAFGPSKTSWFEKYGSDSVAKIRDVNNISDPTVPRSMRTLTADHYLLPLPGASYFEVTILECPLTSAISIGVSILVGEHSRRPHFTLSYIGESGWYLGWNCPAVPYGYPYGQGDIIGCGIDYKSCHIFFTKNGRCLGCADTKVDGRMTPTVFSMETSLKIKGNFGQEKFAFNIAEHGWDNQQKCRRCYHEDGSLKSRWDVEPEAEEEWRKEEERW